MTGVTFQGRDGGNVCRKPTKIKVGEDSYPVFNRFSQRCCHYYPVKGSIRVPLVEGRTRNIISTKSLLGLVDETFGWSIDQTIFEANDDT